MDDYHEFGRYNVVEIDACRRHWSPNYMSITQDSVGINGYACGVVTSEDASSSTSGGTSEGTRSYTSGSTNDVAGEGSRSDTNVNIGGATDVSSRNGNSGRTGSSASGDTRSDTSSTAVGSLGGVVSGISSYSPIAKFFKRLRKNYRGVKTKKLRSLQEFKRKTDESL